MCVWVCMNVCIIYAIRATVRCGSVFRTISAKWDARAGIVGGEKKKEKLVCARSCSHAILGTRETDASARARRQRRNREKVKERSTLSPTDSAWDRTDNGVVAFCGSVRHKFHEPAPNLRSLSGARARMRVRVCVCAFVVTLDSLRARALTKC